MAFYHGYSFSGCSRYFHLLFSASDVFWAHHGYICRVWVYLSSGCDYELPFSDFIFTTNILSVLHQSQILVWLQPAGLIIVQLGTLVLLCRCIVFIFRMQIWFHSANVLMYFSDCRELFGQMYTIIASSGRKWNPIRRTFETVGLALCPIKARLNVSYSSFQSYCQLVIGPLSCTVLSLAKLIRLEVYTTAELRMWLNCNCHSMALLPGHV